MGSAIKAAVQKSGSQKVGESANSFFDLSANDIEGKNIDFSTFKTRKAILVVNVACK